jgi:DNA-binding CsgD family transcriptional regulator
VNVAPPALSRLSPRRFLALNRLLVRLHEERRAEALPGLIVEGLGGVIAAPYVVCRIVATADRSFRGASSAADRWAPLASSFEGCREHDPLPNHRREFLRDGALAISDFMARDAWRALPFYRNFCSRFGIEDQLSIECPHGVDGTLHVVISRGDYGAFPPSDRWVLNSIRPHLRQVCAPTPPTAASMDAAELLENVVGEGVIIFEEFSGSATCSEPTRLLVEKCGLGVVERWVRREVSKARGQPGTPPARSFQRPSFECGGVRFSLRLDAPGLRHLVFVRVAKDEGRLARLEKLGLTAREAEVLLWLAHGKSNQEIGAILGVSASTVRTHLRAVFLCLGVESRTAAAACAWEVQGSLR